MLLVCSRCGARRRPGQVRCPACQTEAPLEERSREPTDPWAGRTLAGRYRLEGVLGEGSMGRVYAATRVADGAPVAIKVLRPRWASDEVAVRRFEREAETASRLAHPAVVKVLESGLEESGRRYLVMERIEGMDLHRWIEARHPLVPRDIVRILDDVLGALEEAHAEGILHRDLKSENVLVVETESGVRGRVCDFGIVKLFGDESSTALTARGHVCGTPEFMAPEQIRGGPIDPRTDVYAVGCILYHMLTGRLPFQGGTSHEVLRRHLKERPMPPSERAADTSVHPGLERVCLRALAKDPSRRFASAAEMRRALREALAVEEGGGGLWRGWIGWVALLLAGLLLGGGVGWLLMR